MQKLPPAPPASSPSTRKTMQANRGKNTGPELELRRLLRNAGYPGYRLHWKKAPGHPDIAYPGRRIAVFVNGCFWHRCPHCNAPMPKSNTEFWQAKFAANRERDARKTAELEAAGWTVLTVWECQVRDEPIGVVSDICKVLSAAE
jgi:DNA mismatch endonuclease, patch repair protein